MKNKLIDCVNSGFCENENKLCKKCTRNNSYDLQDFYKYKFPLQTSSAKFKI